MGFDWGTAETLFVGVCGGIIIGGYVVVGFLRNAFYEMLSHPTARKLANAADKFSGKVQEGGVLGIIGGLATHFFPPKGPAEGGE